MFKLVDITFHANTEYADTSALLKAQETSLIYIDPFKAFANVEVIKHYDNPEMQVHREPGYHFFPAKNYFGYFSFATMRWLKNAAPDILFVRGLIFPIQVIWLRWLLGKKVKIIVRHHADRPFRGIKKIIQRLADKCIHAYLFTSYGNAGEWVTCGIIGDEEKVFELPGTITRFSKLDKPVCHQATDMPEGLNYLWVGRLNINKDPLMVLTAFQQFLELGHAATLHFIFQTNELLDDVKKKIDENILLQTSVVLHGRINYEELPAWFSAADLFISSSHSEGGSSAILEAMACGCIPVVSNIPSSMKVIDNGRHGLFFSPGNTSELLDQLIRSTKRNNVELSASILSYYHTSLSPSAVAAQLFFICTRLLGK